LRSGHVAGLFRSICEHAAGGKWQATVEIGEKLRHLYQLLALETNPIPVKWVLHKMGLVGTGIRLPLRPLDKRYYPAISPGLKKLGLL
jgi:4-hydroxy-tetrahydrodipicolinate synthase